MSASISTSALLRQAVTLLACCLPPLLLLLLAPSSVRAATSCDFTIVFPNTSYPQLGELLSGSLSWNDTLFPIIGYGPFGNGYQLLELTGSRTIWTASASDNTTYLLSSTSDIVGLIPVGNYIVTGTTTPGLGPPLEFGGVIFPPNLTFTGGAYQGVPVELFWDNLIYPGSGQKLDVSGLLLNLSEPQLGSIPVFGLGNLYTVYAYDSIPSLTADLTDDVSLDYLGPPLDAAGYGGSMTLSDCVGPAGRVFGDPQLYGFAGQSYQVHGLDQQVYNIVTAAALQVNALFVFLSSGRCPVREGGRLASNCWSHSGSYFGQLSVQTQQGDRLIIVAGAADVGFHSVTLNGQRLLLGSTVPAVSSLQLRLSSSYACTIRTGLLSIEVENSDGFLNLLSVTPSSLQALARADTHGLLGQTWRRPSAKSAQVAAIEGAVDDYALPSNDMWGSDFPYNRFQQQ